MSRNIASNKYFHLCSDSEDEVVGAEEVGVGAVLSEASLEGSTGMVESQGPRPQKKTTWKSV